MTRSLIAVALCALLWALGSTWYYDCKIKRVCGPEAAASVSPAAAELAAPRALPAMTVTRSNGPLLTAYFGRKSAELVVSAAAEAALPELLDAVKAGRKLLVVGHSDGRGKPELKAELALRRAELLRDWLIENGIPAAAIVGIESRHDREPVADNATAVGRAQNRRAVVLLAP